MGKLFGNVSSGRRMSRNILAINSGLAFTKACYQKISPFYDERLKFYTTDTDFFVRYEKSYEYLYVLDSELDHDLSEYTSYDIESSLYRFQEMIRGLRIVFSEENIFFCIALEVYLLVSAVRKTISNRRIGFIKAFLGSVKDASSAH